MKDLKKINISGGNELVRGNNKKFLIFDNHFKNDYINENNSQYEVSLIFYDINNAATLLNISDVNDVSEWNTAFDYNNSNNGGFYDKDYNKITFDSCVVDGNKLTLILSNYGEIYGFEIYEYDNVGEHLIKDGIIKNIILYYIYLENEEFARNINDDIVDSVGGYDDYRNEPFYFQLSSYGYTGTTFNGNNLSYVTDLSISEAINLEEINLNSIDVRTFSVSSCQSLTGITFNSEKLLTAYVNDCNSLGDFDVESTSLSNITFNNSSLNNFSNKTFSGLTYFYSYNLQMSEFSNNNLPIINDFTMNNGGLTKFNNNNLPLVNNFNVNNPNLTSFSNNNLPIISFVNLDGNNIDTFSGNTLNAIQFITLNSNNLTSFNDNNFPSLIQLYLENNNIETFSGNTFPSLQNLYLKNNNITNFDCDVSTAYQIDLQNNNIVNFTSTLDGIHYIDLTNNNLTSTSVNFILAQLVLHGKVNGFCFTVGTNGPATGQGLIDKATLISRGWNVLTNV